MAAIPPVGASLLCTPRRLQDLTWRSQNVSLPGIPTRACKLHSTLVSAVTWGDVSELINILEDLKKIYLKKYPFLSMPSFGQEVHARQRAGCTALALPWGRTLPPPGPHRNNSAWLPCVPHHRDTEQSEFFSYIDIVHYTSSKAYARQQVEHKCADSVSCGTYFMYRALPCMCW